MKAKTFNAILITLLVISLGVWFTNAEFGPTWQRNLRPVLNLFAVLGMIFYFAQFILSIRTRFIEEGFGLDRMLQLHRYAGRIAVAFFTLHGLLVFLSQWIRNGSISISFNIAVGLVALLGLMVTAGLASTYKLLKLKYEIWKNIHLFNYILFPVALFHVYNNSDPGSFFYYLWILMGIGYAIILFQKAGHILSLRSNLYTVTEVKKENDELWSLYFTGKPKEYKPGQFMILQLIRGGQRDAPHPFTISSSPTSKNLSVSIKELGDFTQTIKDTKTGDLAMIDAPYGVFSILNHPASNYIFAAGGIGITPFMSMLRYLHDSKLEKRITLFWGNQSEGNLAFQSELEDIMHDNPALQIVLVMSNQKDWPGEKGYIDAGLMKKYHPFDGDTHFFLCGPPPMTRAVLKSLLGDGIPKDRIHFEVFEL